MSLAGVNRREEPQVRLAELERKNQLLEAEVQQLRVYKDYAYTDVLTEVPNRRFYHERLVQEMARSRRGRHPLGLALVDLDYFKEINDQIGHRAGDQVLKFFAQFLRVNLRQEDILSRIGGDEFSVILPDTDSEQAEIFFDRVKAKLDRVDLSLADQPTGCVRGKPGEVQLRRCGNAALFGSQIRSSVRPKPTETRADQYDRSVGYPAVLLLPGLEVADRNAVVAVRRAARCHVDEHRGAH